MGEKLEITSKVYLSPFGITRAERKLYLTSARYRTLFGRASYNSPSRFIGEISDDFVENVSRGNGFAKSNKRTIISESQRSPVISKSAYKKSGGDKLGWNVGDKAVHKKWGTGMVVSVKGSGEDTELDIAFPNPVGIKRLLAKFAPIEKA